jgi:iron complex outermembrane receptor protein
MLRSRAVGFVTVVILVLMGTAAAAQNPPASPDTQTPPPAGSNPQGLPTITLPTVQVVGTTPLPGTGIDRDKVPANVQSLTSSDLASEGSASLINSLTDQAGSVNVNATLDDPFQPDILFRGFEASPVLGTPQGMAVYQNGVRIN